MTALVCPKIESYEQAVMFGKALASVSPINANWAPQMYRGDLTTWRTGPDILNRELEDIWNHQLDAKQRKRLIVAYVMTRLT